MIYEMSCMEGEGGLVDNMWSYGERAEGGGGEDPPEDQLDETLST